MDSKQDETLQINMDNVPIISEAKQHESSLIFTVPNEIIDGTSIPPNEYTKLQLLGKGHFSQCFVVTSDKFNQHNFACKIIPKTLLTMFPNMERITQEITIHRALQHPNIVQFYSYFEDSLLLYLILECCENQSLHELIVNRTWITEPEARYFVKQICEALSYLHNDKKVIHRDLKPTNIFLSVNMKIKIGDFGLATYRDMIANRKRMSNYGGGPNYMSPEMITNGKQGYETDIWSTGCVFYVLLYGTPPFQSDDLEETYKRIIKGDLNFPSLPNPITMETTNFINRILHVDYINRPTANQILNEEYLKCSFIPEALLATALTIAPTFSTYSCIDQANSCDTPVNPDNSIY